MTYVPKNQALVQPFIDGFGCLDKVNGRDGGDSCQRDFMYCSLVKMLPYEKRIDWPLSGTGRLTAIVTKYHVAHGVLVRHPDVDRQASDWDRGSRDQTIPFLVAMSVWGWQKELWKYFLGHARRLFFFHNFRQNGATKRNHGKKDFPGGKLYDYSMRIPDISDPEIFGLYIRGFRLWLLWPLLIFCDLFTLGGAIHKRWFSKSNIVFNHELIVLHSRHVMPTGIGWICQKIYDRERAIEKMADHFADFGGYGKDMTFFLELFDQVYDQQAK